MSPLPDLTGYAIVDCESNGVEDTALPWEIGILTHTGHDWAQTLIQVIDYPAYAHMSEEADAVNGYSRRFLQEPEASNLDRVGAVHLITDLLQGKMLVGANVWKDARWLENLGASGWHYRMTDLGSMFHGAYGYRPGGQWAIAEVLEIDQPAGHTALGDARVAAQIFEHILLDRR